MIKLSDNYELQIRHNVSCVSCYDHFLVGSDQLYADLGIGLGEHALLAVDGGVVDVLVEVNAEAGEVVADLFAQNRLVFAQTGGENDRVASSIL